MDELTSTSAVALARAIRNGEVSSAEVVETHLRRIEAVNGRLNAVVQLDGERALELARLADAALVGGNTTGPLHGVPMTLKDSIDTAGVVRQKIAERNRMHPALRQVVVDILLEFGHHALHDKRLKC